jgi:tetratricopeptide (TPR) repeat protein
MNTDHPSPRNGLAAGAVDDSEVVRVLDAYLSGIEAGQAPDPEKLLADHPEISNQLRAYLQVMQLADRMAEGSVHAARAMLAEASTEGSSARIRVAVAQSSSDPSSSVISTLDLGPGPAPQIQLRDPMDDGEPLVMPRSTEMPAPAVAGNGRYQLQGEIARGGMGAILRGRDVDLGRELAIKVLLESHRRDPQVVRRFVEEAQIGGQLQHPGVVPVYELGTFPDRRPYFAMKLVKGRTLAALLHDRADPLSELPRFLSIFEQVCQTMAYAHARCVIHRDLKPSNVMVGSFGEVQVMDWGLAKVLPEGGVADEAKSREREETYIATVRSGPAASGSESQAGSVLGTPAYMAPEQARGEIERIDERADVFGLGAILCEILTGHPPFAGSSREKIRAQAARGDLARALDRLEHCRAGADLIGLAHDCLEPEPERRPRSATEVARRMTSYQESVQARLKAAELARVEAQTRAEEAQARGRIERSRHHRTIALAASIFITMGVAGVAWSYVARQREEQALRFGRELSGAESLFSEARRAGDDLARWLAAREAGRTLEARLGDAPDEAGRLRANALIRDVNQGIAAAYTDQKVLAKLIDIRSASADDPDGTLSDAAYEEAFRDAEIDLATMSPDEAGAKIQAKPATTRKAMTAALDDWAAVRRTGRRDTTGALKLTDTARVADPDPWRNRLRELLKEPSGKVPMTSLRELAASAKIDELPEVSVSLLGETLIAMGDPASAEVVLRRGQRSYPGDVWLNYNLAECLQRLSRRDEAIRYYIAAKSLRPETAHSLGHALEANGETEQSISVFQDLARLRPDHARHLACLGQALQGRGRAEEAKRTLNAATAVARASLQLSPGSPDRHFTLGYALYLQGHWNEAITEYHAALRVKPDSAELHRNLGVALMEQRKLDAAIAEYRTAIRLKPDDDGSHSSLGVALAAHGKLDEAIAEYREALRLKPDLVYAHNGVGNALTDQGQRDEAIAEYRTALRLKPDYAEAHSNLGAALQAQGKLEEAIAEGRAAIRFKPDYADAHNNLGVALAGQGKLEEAYAEYREALRLKPDHAIARNNLGCVLREQGKLEEAIAEHRTALGLKPDLVRAHSNLGIALAAQGKLDEAIAEYREALRLKPDLVYAHNGLGNALTDQGKLDEAIAEYRTALRLKPDFVEAHYNYGRALSSQGNWDDAVAEYRTALRLKPDDAEAHCNLGEALKEQGKLDEAIAEHRIALRLNPNLFEAHGNLGNALHAQGKLDEAITEYRTALRLKPDSAEAHTHLGSVLEEQGKLEEAIAEHRTALRLKPDSAEAHTHLGIALKEQGKLDEAIAEHRTSLRLNPELFEAHTNLGIALVALGKLNEAVAAFRTALRLKPDSKEAHNNLGGVLNMQGKHEEAIAELRIALNLKPGSADAHNNIGAALHDMGKLDAAIAEFREAVRLKPGYTDARNNLGRTLREQGKPADAIAEFRTAIRLKPDDAVAHNELGAVLADQGKLDESIAEFRTAIRLKPGLVEPHSNLGWALTGQGKLDEAVAECQDALRLKPDFADAHNNLGVALRHNGKLEAAIAEFREALRLKPDFADARNNLGDTLMSQGKVDEAIADFREALRLKPVWAEARNNLASALANQGKLDEAIAMMRTALRLKPDYVAAHYNLGFALKSQGQREEAIAAFRAALRLGPDSAETHTRVGFALRSMGQYAEALAAFRRAHALGSKQAGWTRPSAEWVRETERLLALDQKLPAILSGTAKPADAAESAALAQMCYDKKLHGASARWWSEAFQLQPKLAGDMQVQNRYNAACAAALAGCGQAKDEPPRDDSAKTRWRKQAIDWLNADLAAWSKILESGPPQARQSIPQTLEHWKADSDLAGLRESAALAKLPADEQKACRAMWGQVDALLEKARAATRP